MPLVVDGVSIPIEAIPNQQAFQAAQKMIQDTNKAQNEQNKILDERKAKIKNEQDAIQKAETAKQKAIQQTTAALMKQREQMERLMQIGRQMAVAGGAIVGAFTLAAKNFVDKASAADKVANKWRDSTDRITEAQMKLGRVAADVLNPTYSQLADTMEKVAALFQNNPQMASSALSMGATLLAGGGAVAALANMSKTLLTLGSMTGSAGLAGAGSALGKVSEIALYATTVVLAAEAGLAIGNAIQKAAGIGQGKESWADVLQTFLDIPPAMLTIFQNGMNAILAKLGIHASLNIPIVRARVPGSQATTSPTRAGGQSPDERGEAGLTDAQRQASLKAAEDAAKESQRLAALDHERNMKLLDAKKAEAQKEADIHKAMADETQQFLQSEKDATQDYYNRRSDMARAAGVEAQRAEEDHQKKIKQILEEGNVKINQAAQDRDALALVRAKRDTEKARSDEEANYRVEVKRRNQDFAEKIREMDRDFSIERSRRLREYEFKQKAYQAEVEMAQAAYQAIVNSLLQLKRDTGPTYTNGVESSRNYAGASQVNSSTSTSSTATVNLNAGALSVRQVQNIATGAATAAALKALGGMVAQ